MLAHVITSSLGLAAAAIGCGGPAAGGRSLALDTPRPAAPPSPQAADSASIETPAPATLGGGAGVPQLGEPGADPAACASVTATTSVISAPLGVIVLRDDSGSMSDEAAEVGANLDSNFARILENSGVDYRVILISQQREN